MPVYDFCLRLGLFFQYFLSFLDTFNFFFFFFTPNYYVVNEKLFKFDLAQKKDWENVKKREREREREKIVIKVYERVQKKKKKVRAAQISPKR